MTMTRVLQPFVCCIGNPVAGNPTQFVMYRAARACGADWRFFTSQVAPDQFETAFRGVQALGLNGVALFEPFQSQAIPLLHTVTEAALVMGAVNVARSDSDSWLGDNTLGQAIINCLRYHQSKQLRSNGPSPEGEEAAPATLVVASDTYAKVIRLAAQGSSDRILSLVDELPSPNNASPELPQSGSDWMVTLDSLVQNKTRIRHLVMEQTPSLGLIKQLSALDWESNANCLLLHPGSERSLQPWRNWIRERELNSIEYVDLMAHQAAADFSFWTELDADIDLIRDSLEEYLQW